MGISQAEACTRGCHLKERPETRCWGQGRMGTCGMLSSPGLGAGPQQAVAIQLPVLGTSPLTFRSSYLCCLCFK